MYQSAVAVVTLHDKQPGRHTGWMSETSRAETAFEELNSRDRPGRDVDRKGKALAQSPGHPNIGGWEPKPEEDNR